MGYYCRCFGDHEVSTDSHCIGQNGQRITNSTCDAPGKCYLKVTAISENEHVVRMGCLPAHADGDLIDQCHSSVNHTENIDSYFVCCDPMRNGSLCNDHLERTKRIPEYKPPVSHEQQLAQIIGLSLFVTFAFTVISYVFYKHLQNRKHSKSDPNQTGTTLLTDALLPSRYDGTSGSGAGPQNLAQRTIAKQVTEHTYIGSGRYGHVYKASYNVETVAKKVFLPEWEECWTNEWKMFQNVNLRDERIVGFLAHDIEQSHDQINRIIIMDYMKHGSLQNYLNNQKLSENDAIKLISSLIQGVMFLHTEVRGSDQIASVAHRDISSKSVLINADGQCCISDFGMAISRSLQNKQPEYNVGKRLPTPLYAPPEHFHSMFSNQPTMIDFEELMAGDIYSVALLFWEISNRVTSSRYTLALSAEINARFSITSENQIDNVVMLDIHASQIRPNKPVWSPLYEIMTESWAENWRDRLTALRIFQNLRKHYPTFETV